MNFIYRIGSVLSKVLDSTYDVVSPLYIRSRLHRLIRTASSKVSWDPRGINGTLLAFHNLTGKILIIGVVLGSNASLLRHLRTSSM